MHLSIEDLTRHLLVIGASGVGKSFALLGWIVQLIKMGRGVTVLDPHGTLVKALELFIAQYGRRFWGKVVIIRPTDPQFVVPFNPMHLRPGEYPERRARVLATQMTETTGTDPDITVRMQRIMEHTFEVLIRSHLPLTEFARVLTEKDFRDSLLGELSNADRLRGYWYFEFPKQENTARDWAQSSLNRVDAMVRDPDLRAMFGSSAPGLDVAANMNEERIVLIDLSKGELGKKDSQTLGKFIIGEYKLAAMRRAQSGNIDRKPFHYLVIDEYHNFVVGSLIEEMLEEVRKFRLGLMLAQQHLGQLQDNKELKAAVLSTVKNWAIFQISAQDAGEFAADVFNTVSLLDQIKDIRYRMEPTGIDWWPYRRVEEIQWMSVEEINQRQIQAMTLLADREFIFKQKGPFEPVWLRTPQIPTLSETPELKQAVRQVEARSQTYYGKRRAELEAEIDKRQQQFDKPIVTTYEVIEDEE